MRYRVARRQTTQGLGEDRVPFSGSAAGWLAAAVLAATFVAGAAGAADAPSQSPGEAEISAVAWPTISTDEVSRGQKGYGLSVFAGTEPQRFEVEVLGVLRQTTPGLSYILARLTGHDLERSGVVAGMSGSPVYLDDRLAGAVAFSYVFGLDAIAGITPIEAMRRLSDLPVGSVPRSAAFAADQEISFAALLERDFSADLLDRYLERLRPPARQGARPSIQWTASGFGEDATALLRRSLGDLTLAGATSFGATSFGASSFGAASGGGGDGTAADATLVAGSAVAAVLVRGDLNLAAHGTVTDRNGDELLAFGHSMFSLGPVNLPLAPSEVVTVIANAANSFKVSNAGAVIGAFDQDREAGVRGRLGLAAPTTPLTVRLHGLSRREYHMEVANLPQLRPILLAISTLGALNSGSYAGGSQGIDMRARIAMREHEDLVIRQSFDGDQAGIDSVLHLLSFTAFLELNPLAEVEIESVEVDLDQVESPRSARLLAAHPERTRLEPGQKVAVTLDLQPYRGPRVRHRLMVEVPESVPDGRFVVLIGDGTSMDAARLSFERREPTSFDQALELMRSFRSRRELTVLGLLPSPGLAVAGDVLPDLPGSLRAIFAAGSAAAGAPLSWRIQNESVETLERPIEGILRVDLEVRRRPK